MSTDASRATLNVFADGYFCAFVDGEMAVSFGTILITHDFGQPIHNWDQMTAGGAFTTHDPGGKVMYGAAVSVSGRFQGLGIGTMLIEHAKRYLADHDLDGFVAGVRIPLYRRYREMPVEASIEKSNDDGSRFAPDLRFYERCLTIGAVLPEYMSGT